MAMQRSLHDTAPIKPNGLGPTLCCGLLLLAIVGPANAHVTLADGDARAGGSYRGIIKVPHGCGASPTKAIQISIPEGVIGVKPMPKAGWTLEIKRGAYAKSYQNHGATVSEGPKQIVWSGGNLPDDNYDEFVFSSTIAGDLAAGQMLYFPTVQTCASGESRWIDIPATGQSRRDVRSPAPSVRIAGGDQGDQSAAMDHSAMDHGKMDHGTAERASTDKPVTVGQAGADVFKAGDMTVSTPWTRATPNGAKIAGGYLTITNTGSAPDRLVSVVSSITDRVEIHEMSMDGGVMKMRQLSDGLVIKPGESVALKPGGFHMMFMDIKQPLKQGETLKATLQFEKAGKLDVVFDVNAIGASAPAAHQH